MNAINRDVSQQTTPVAETTEGASADPSSQVNPQRASEEDADCVVQGAECEVRPADRCSGTRRVILWDDVHTPTATSQTRAASAESGKQAHSGKPDRV